MEPIKILEIEKAVRGKLIGRDIFGEYINKVSTDSRDDLKDSLFIALKGEKFDGHDYIKMAFEKGAKCCISQIDLDTQYPYIKVESTKNALMDLAEYYRSLVDIKVVDITGSSGKNTLRLLPALSVSEEEMSYFTDCFRKTWQKMVCSHEIGTTRKGAV